MNLIYKQINNQKFHVLTPNNHLVGELIMDVDGYFYFWPSNDGCWSSHIMRSIANKLDDINKPWNDEVTEYFEKEKIIL